MTSAIVGAAAAGAPRGISVSSAKPIGTTVTEMSARRVPETTGVMIRLSWLSRAAITNWQTADATTRVASSSGPPADRARAATPMEVPDAPITIRLPAPIPATRLACRMVVASQWPGFLLSSLFLRGTSRHIASIAIGTRIPETPAGG